MREQLRMFVPTGEASPSPVGTTPATRPARPHSPRKFRLPLDLALWVREEAAARDWPPDLVVAVAVAKLQQNTVWAGGRDD